MWSVVCSSLTDVIFYLHESATGCNCKLCATFTVLISGAGQRDVMDDQYSYLNGSVPENKGFVNITTPPRVLTVDERFPVIQDQPEAADTSLADPSSQSVK